MSVFICDAGLFSKGSHHFNWACQVSSEFVRHGLVPRIFAYRHAAPDVLADTGAIDHFTDLLYNKHCNQRPFDEEYNWRGLNASFRADMERIESEIAQPDAIVIVPAVTQHQIEGLAQWFVALRPERRPKLAVCLMFHPDWTPWGDRAIRGAEYYARAISRLKPWIGQSVLLYTETEEIKAYFETLTGVPIEVAPIPWGAPTRYPRNTRNRRMRFGYLGHSRNERGFHLLPEAVEICLNAGLSFELLIQIQHGNYEPATIRADQLLRLKPNVSSFLGPLEIDDYYRALDSCDAILIPYDPNMYRTRGSGLFAESIIYGKPIIVTAGTAMAQAADRGECVARLCAFNSSSLADAMIDVARRRDEFARYAIKAGQAWYQANNVRVYCRRMLEFAGYRGAALPAEDTAASLPTSAPAPEWPLGRTEKPASRNFPEARADCVVPLKSPFTDIPFTSVGVQYGGTLLLGVGRNSSGGEAGPSVFSVKINGHQIADLTLTGERAVYRIENDFRWLLDGVPSVLTIESTATADGNSSSPPILHEWGFMPRSRWRRMFRNAVAGKAIDA